ncbi:hypothetical protein MYX76_14320 [Desulfobacterota bacterium AH_259_B03_O07]|nr:hypothetical protein [Desulfobacterota bacterium AH_259_B03_O07]
MKKKSKKKKETYPESLLEKANHIKPITSFAFRSLSRIYPICNSQQFTEFWDSTRNESVAGVKTKAEPDIPPEIIAKDVTSYRPIKSANRDWLLTLIDIGTKIKKFWLTKNQDMAVKIIRKYPGIIFDDGTEINLSLFLCMPPKDYKKFMVKVGLWEMMDKKDKKIYGYPEDATVHKYDKGGFYNPIVSQIIWWRGLTDYGNPEEQKRASDCLRKAGLECFILTSSGRKKKASEFKPDSKSFYDNPFYQYLETHFSLPEQIIKTYRACLKDIQARFKVNKPKYQANRRRILLKYIDEKELYERINSFNSNLNIKSAKSALAEKWAGIHPSGPSNIAWHISSEIFGISIRTLKKLSAQKV